MPKKPINNQSAMTLAKDGFMKNKYYLLGLLLLTGIVNILTLSVPLINSKILDNYQNVGNLNFPLIIISLLGLGLIILGLSLGQIYLANLTGETFAFDLRMKLLKKLNLLNYRQLENYSLEKLYTNFTSDIEKSKQVITTLFVTLFSAILILLGSMITLLIVNWQLAFLAMGLMAVIILVFSLIFGNVTKYFSQSQKNLESLNKVINENLQANSLVRILKSFEDWEEPKFEKYNIAGKNISLNIIKYFSFLIPSINFLSALGSILILYFSVRLVQSGSFTLGNLNAFLSYFALLIQPIFIIGFVSSIVTSAYVSLSRLDSFLNLEVQSDDKVEFSESIKTLEFQNVSLDINGKKILSDINFALKTGQRIAILGPVGSGKTTILNLILGLSEPTSGQILLNNQSISNLSQHSLTNKINVVFQDSIIFNDTLKKNIIFENKIEAEDFEKAVKTSEVDEFAQKIPNKYNSLINEKGSNLSGGQKQRVTLARALVRNPEILLLDDFTARVDIETEKKIQKNLKQYYPNLTLISIVQKISSVIDFDQIIYLMNGQVVAIGKHEELLAKSADYLKLFESQKTVNS
jgi:ATP-binding cassette, subfamily B, bacterial